MERFAVQTKTCLSFSFEPVMQNSALSVSGCLRLQIHQVKFGSSSFVIQ